MSYKRIEFAHGADEDDDGDIMMQPLHLAASEPPSITVTGSSMSTLTPAPYNSIDMMDDASPSIMSSSPGESMLLFLHFILGNRPEM